jgi:uncharacterized protein (PEP-CTERM system associated)
MLWRGGLVAAAGFWLSPGTALPQDAGAGGAGGGLGSSLLQSGPPQAGGTRVGDLRDQIAASLGLNQTGDAGAPPIQFTPALQITQEVSSNSPPAAGLKQTAWITLIQPSLTVSAASERVQGTLVYAPSVQIYETQANQDQVAQNLNGNAHISLLPDRLFLDLNAFAAQQAAAGATGPTNSTVLNRTNSVQTYSFSATPYLRQRLGSFGTVELGGSIGESVQNGQSVTVATLPGLPPTVIGSQDDTSTEEHLAFTSGEDFGRTLVNSFVSATQSTGTGVLGGAHRNTASFEGGYAVTREITVLGTIGYDDILYSSAPPVRIDSALWNVGVLLVPNPDSQITLRYGRKDGVDAPFAAASYALTARTRLFANYSQQISTDQEQLSTSLANATVDTLGNAVDPSTGAPLLAASNFFGVQSAVLKFETATVGATLLLDRDSFVLSVNHSRQTPQGLAVGNNAFSSVGTYGSLQWQHDLREDLTASFALEYGVLDMSTAALSQSSTLFTGTATLAYLITPSLSANLSYSHTDTSYRRPFPDQTGELIAVALRKTF